MRLMRVFLFAYAIIALIVAYVIFRAHWGLVATFYVVINGSIVAVAAIFEHGRYKPKLSASEDWETTDEKFQDATTGKWMAVRYNRRTGERDYIELKPSDD